MLVPGSGRWLGWDFSITHSICSETDDISLLEIFSGSGFDLVLSSVAFNRSPKVVWTWFDRAHVDIRTSSLGVQFSVLLSS